MELRNDVCVCVCVCVCARARLCKNARVSGVMVVVVCACV